MPDPSRKQQSLAEDGMKVSVFATARRVAVEFGKLVKRGLFIYDIQKVRNFTCWKRAIEPGPEGRQPQKCKWDFSRSPQAVEFVAYSANLRIAAGWLLSALFLRSHALTSISCCARLSWFAGV